MSDAGRARIAAVVPAAGASSRMGTSKPLVQIGGRSTLQRVIDCLSRAAVNEIIVVTEPTAEELTVSLEDTCVCAVPNRHPERGMFSSVRAGVAALERRPDAFFVLPADYALIRPRIPARLIEHFDPDRHDVVHPCCCRLRGHPPLISGTLVDTLLRVSSESNLREFLSLHAYRAAEVELDDATILMDMDLPEDLEHMRRFARFTDEYELEGGSRCGSHNVEPGAGGCSGSDPHRTTEWCSEALAIEDALYLLSVLHVPEPVVAHCRMVAEVGEVLAAALHPKLPTLDIDLVRTACLLHDLAKAKMTRGHAPAAERVLNNLGLPRLAAIVGAHMVLPGDPARSPVVTEAELVYLADKLVVDDRVAGLRERTIRARDRCVGNNAALEAITARTQAAGVISAKVEAIVGRPLKEALSAVGSARK